MVGLRFDVNLRPLGELVSSVITGRIEGAAVEIHLNRVRNAALTGMTAAIARANRPAGRKPWRLIGDWMAAVMGALQERSVEECLS